MEKLVLTQAGLPAGGEQIHSEELLDSDALMFAVIGASAVGKSAIVQALCEHDIVEATPTWTTRPPRPGERNTSYDHHFVSEEEFERQSEEGGFIDQHTFYGAQYGMPALEEPPAGKEASVVLKPVFMPRFIEKFPRARIYQIEASPVLLPGRMRDRGQSETDILERMKLHTREATEAHKYAHVVFTNNGPLEKTVEQVKAQMRTDRAAYEAAQLRQP